MGEALMATSAERIQAARARKKKDRIVLNVEVDETDLREIAIAGYQDAVSTDRAAQGKAVSLFVSDTLNGCTLRIEIGEVVPPLTTSVAVWRQGCNAVALTRRNAVALTATPSQSPGPKLIDCKLHLRQWHCRQRHH
jgi:hypothetical protein